MIYKEAVKSRPNVEKTQSSLVNLADPDKINNLKADHTDSKTNQYGWKFDQENRWFGLKILFTKNCTKKLTLKLIYIFDFKTLSLKN